jgi:uncharacterized OB-fold protein
MSESGNHLFICPDCSTVTFENVDACPACESEEERLTLGFEIANEVQP